MRIGLTGPGGQLGQDVQKIARLIGPGVEIVPLNRQVLDLTDVSAGLADLDRLALDVLINTAAAHHVPSIEQDDSEAWAVNRDGPAALAAWAETSGVRLVHVSTDYVFGGEQGRDTPHMEGDTPNPVNRYGATKAAGEEAVLAASEHHLIVRTASLFGVAGARGKGGNFIETMLRLAREGKALNVVADQRMNPSHTLSVAAHILQLAHSGAPGVVHASGAGDASWFELAKAALDASVPGADLSPTTAAAFGDPTPRPAYSVLNLDRLRGLLGTQAVEPWTAHVAHYLQVAGHAPRTNPSGVDAAEDRLPPAVQSVVSAFSEAKP